MSRSVLELPAPPEDPVRREVGRLVREGLLWTGAIGGAICLVLGVLAVAFGVKPVIFRSGSMSPAIGTGALAFTHPVDASGLHVGDIVTVRTEKGVRVTHRIRSITPGGDQATLVLKGDANEVVDSEAYVVSSADRVLFSIPKAGYMVNAMSGRLGTFAGGILVGLVLVTAFGRRRDPDRRAPEAPVFDAPSAEVAPSPARSEPAAGRRLVVGLGITLAVITLVAGTRGTTAYFTDSAQVDTGSFTMKVQAPSLTCTKGNSIVTMNWTAVSGATGYTLHYGAGGATTESVGSGVLTKVFNSVGQSGTFTVNAVLPSGPGPASNAKAYVIGNGVGNTSCTDA